MSQAVKHLHDFLDRLNNPALQEHVSPATKMILSTDVTALIDLLPN